MQLNDWLEPLKGASPCGEDMLFSDAFDRIQAARRFDDPSLSQGEWVTDIKEADWSGVVRQCSDLLTEKTKDLRLAVWMTEALAKTKGFEGLATGYSLVVGMLDTLWDDVHPQPEEGDLEQRIGVLDWLLSQSERIVREIPMTRSARGEYSMIDLASAQALTQTMERNPGEAEALKKSARVTQEAFDAARRDSPGAFFVQSTAAAVDARAALQRLEDSVEARFGNEGPAFGVARTAIDAAIELLSRCAREAGVGPEPNTAPPDDETAPGPSARATTAAHTSSTTASIATRAQALAQLKAVADFFRRTEPHSPVAYLADKAARWGEMSLHEWLRTVVKDDGALSHVEELLGVTAASSSDDRGDQT